MGRVMLVDGFDRFVFLFFGFLSCDADGFNFLLTPKQGFQLLAADRALSDWLGGEF
jgi:hypothetical protein